jgi:hypothetical protein
MIVAFVIPIVLLIFRILATVVPFVTAVMNSAGVLEVLFIVFFLVGFMVSFDTFLY